MNSSINTPLVLVEWTDKNYVIRQAIMNAATELERKVMDFSPEQTERYYTELKAGLLSISANLTLPS